MAISKIDSDGIVSGGITADSLNIGQIGGRRNRIINGNMMIDQRNSAGSPITSGGRAYAVDRWSCEKVGEGAFTFGQSSTAPTGFKYSLLATVTTADTSIAPTNIYWFEHRIEGYNINDLEFGTANAKTITLSFWVRSSLTGTYSVCVASTGSKTFEYTINSADTWEYKTIQITGPTATYSPSSLTSGTGINFRFALAVSSNYAQAASSDWTGSDIIGSTNQVNWMNTVGNTFYLTGVQLEVGTVATPFEHRSFGEELQLCGRYFQRAEYFQGTMYQNGTSQVLVTVPLHTALRANPSITYGASTISLSTTASPDFNGYTISSIANPLGHLPVGNPIHTIAFNVSGWSGNDDDAGFYFLGDSSISRLAGVALDAEL